MNHTHIDSRSPDVLPEGVDRTEESYKREIIKLRIENERLKKKLYCPDERGWGSGVHSFKGEDYEIVDLLCRDYDIKDLCLLMGVSRSGFYKWKNRDSSAEHVHRDMLIAAIEQVHKDHSTHGYRWVAAFIRINYTFGCSDSYAYKAFRFLGIKSETRHQVHHRPRKVKDKYPNLIYATWDTVDRPRQVVVSDMTAFHIFYFYIELTFYFDVFTKQILTWRMAERRGSRDQYVDGLEDVVGILRECTEPTVLHTDQGTVYASVAYNELIQDTMIERSMSRAGKPTDNPVNEALNGWIKEELYMDFKLGECRTKEQIRAVITTYVSFYNTKRPCYAIGYDTPDNYYRRCRRGEVPSKGTFKDRVLSETPKFVQKRKAKHACEPDGT